MARTLLILTSLLFALGCDDDAPARSSSQDRGGVGDAVADADNGQDSDSDVPESDADAERDGVDQECDVWQDRICPDRTETPPFGDLARDSSISQRLVGRCVTDCGCAAGFVDPRIQPQDEPQSYDDVGRCLCDALSQQVHATGRIAQGAGVGPCVVDLWTEERDGRWVLVHWAGCELSAVDGMGPYIDETLLGPADCSPVGLLRPEPIAREAVRIYVEE